MLRKTVEPFVGAALDFAPGTSFAYNNANYNILGLIIEAVSGQSYESFMKEQVFEPLGLRQTFLHHSEAIATGKMAQGHRHAFFMTFPFDAPIYGGMKPAGYIISDARDMGRWMGIHLGIVQDIPEIFSRVIEKARQSDTNGPSIRQDVYYAAGWINSISAGIRGHDGQTPNFLSTVLLLTEEKQGVVFLSNGGNVDSNLALSIKAILDGDLQQSYTRSSRQQSDIINSIILVSLAIIAIWYLVAGIRNRMKCKPTFTKTKIVTISIWAFMTVLMMVRLLYYPTTVGSGWAYIFDWNPPTATILLFVAPVFLAIATWYTYTKNPKAKKAKSRKSD
jgi:hypothetical protein